MHVGGPTREFLHLLVGEISRNNSLFCGSPSSRVPLHNMTELSRKTYKFVGAILAFSIVCGGPAPGYFAEAVADYLVYGFDGVKALIGDIPDPLIRDKIAKVNIRSLCETLSMSQ